jgi:cytochrome c553
MKRTVGSGRAHREAIATDCTDRGVNCRRVRRAFGRAFAVHSGFPPVRRDQAQFAPDFAREKTRKRRDRFGSIVGVKTRRSALRLLVRTVLVAGCAAALAAGQPASAQATARTVPDTIAQRMQACTPCHGREGRASPVGYLPRIAGKPASYLFNQLVNFRDGRRYGAAMSYLVEQLSDDYLREIAAYFAAIDVPYPPPPATSEREGVLRRGEALATGGDIYRRVPACTQCHGYALTGALPAIPGLLGLPADYVIGQLGAWKTDNRRATAPDCMAAIAKRLSAEDVRAVAVWLASRPVPAGAKPAPSPDLPLPLECGSGLR